MDYPSALSGPFVYSLAKSPLAALHKRATAFNKQGGKSRNALAFAPTQFPGNSRISRVFSKPKLLSAFAVISRALPQRNRGATKSVTKLSSAELVEILAFRASEVNPRHEQTLHFPSSSSLTSCVVPRVDFPRLTVYPVIATPRLEETGQTLCIYPTIYQGNVRNFQPQVLR